MLVSVYVNLSARNWETLVLGDLLFGISLVFRRYLRNNLFCQPKSSSLRYGFRNRFCAKAANRISRRIVALYFASPAILAMLQRFQHLLQHGCLKLLSSVI